MSKQKHFSLFLMLFAFWAFSCQCSHDDYVPKPNGYLRTDFPAKSYIASNGKLPFSFEYPTYGLVLADTEKNAEPNWINIEFAAYKCKLHLSFKTLNGNLAQFSEDSRKLAYKHTIKADAIDELIINYPKHNVFGTLYSIKGNTACAVQFYVTDSVHNFLRGALYFNAMPNKDSLAPSIDFFRKDVEHFIETVTWSHKN